MMLKISFILLFFITSIKIMAHSPMPGIKTFTNSDSSSVTGYLYGDATFNYIVDKNGRIIKYNELTQNYEYGYIDKINGKDELLPSGIIANDNNQVLHTQSINNAITLNNNINHNILELIVHRKQQEVLEQFK